VVPEGTHAVVLAAESEEALLRVEEKLRAANIEFAAIREPDAPWNGALMAIGVKPQPREHLKRLLSNLPLYRT
jgi:peptidyl-tRNA hydrolase